MNPIRKAVMGAAMVGSAVIGGAVGASFLGGAATAQTTSTTTPAATAPSAAPIPPPRGPCLGGHQANGITEAPLTGDTAAKAKAAALAAVPGGTVEQVENDAEGATYEAHMMKADGSPVTVKMDGSFKVTSIEPGPGR